ncbi:sigma-70 family RNA polymerase sigma factor [Paenibacillus sp. UNC499MF]|uniref:sigma-70 family RNA polymerase sigma factor n=1 Tax=Paenibacillus sp. UNC499MF TaxID=1502751 RepID=UPI0008A01643|nr:sigma-70 family RNA polymerase sigma factor [Paenibacillus sp. UNC499MF]SEG25153.1 RNA polymerase sigma-70 factor, ECF subfamily [Paenibacillus sp. UNC499MF]
MNDEQLEHWLDRLAAGDQEAMEEIYRMTRRKVYGTVAVLVSNKEDVNDIVSEIYYQLWRALPGYDRSRPFHFWLNGIVIRQVSSWRRQLWRRFRLTDKTSRLSEEPHVETPDEALAGNELRQDVRDAINRLPYKLRVVIIYRYFYEYTYDEIAELLAIPSGTVKSRVHLALKQLRNKFDTQLDEEAYPNVYSRKH